jgi:hypothetical protein
MSFQGSTVTFTPNGRGKNLECEQQKSLAENIFLENPPGVPLVKKL